MFLMKLHLLSLVINLSLCWYFPHLVLNVRFAVRVFKLRVISWMRNNGIGWLPLITPPNISFRLHPGRWQRTYQFIYDKRRSWMNYVVGIFCGMYYPTQIAFEGKGEETIVNSTLGEWMKLNEGVCSFVRRVLSPICVVER